MRKQRKATTKAADEFKFIVWGYSTDQQQVVTAVETAKTMGKAITKAERRWKATDVCICSLVPAMYLADYIKKLQETHDAS